jgi:hypothetical protein
MNLRRTLVALVLVLIGAAAASVHAGTLAHRASLEDALLAGPSVCL